MVAPDSQANHACRQAASPLNALYKTPEPPRLPDRDTEKLPSYRLGPDGRMTE
jgi:hypothetical protein